MGRNDNELPAPLTPADCDLRGNDWMPVHGARLYSSDFDAHASDAEWRAGHKLWWAAWNQVPAASLPDDDAILCRDAGFGRNLKAWAKVKKMALWGFVKCSDGRLYHRFLASEALKAFDLRVKFARKRDLDRKRLSDWRGRKTEDEDQTCLETQDETRFNKVSKLVSERASSQVNKTVQDKTLTLCSVQVPAKSPAKQVPLAQLAEFEAFWGKYPRKVGKDGARRAWVKALKRADAADILTGLDRATFSPDPQYIPYPATWLNAGRWADDPHSLVAAAAKYKAQAERPSLGTIRTGDGRLLTAAELRECST